MNVSVGMMLAACLLVAAPVEAARADLAGAPSSDRLAITTVVGTGDAGFAGDGRRAVKAAVGYPQAVATAPDGTLYVLTGLRIRAVDPKTGTIETIAGTGKPGFSGDGGPATKARFSDEYDGLYGVTDLTVGADGTLYVADAGNHRVRAIDPDTGTIETVAGSGGTGPRGSFSGDGGPARKARLSYPRDVAVGQDGTLYIADSLNYRIRAVDKKSGRIETIAGVRHPGDEGSGFFPKPDDDGRGRATNTFVEPTGLTVGTDGTVYFADTDEDRVRAVDPEKDTIVTVAGTGGPYGATGLGEPTDLAAGADGVLYIATNDVFAVDHSKNRVHRLDLDEKRLTHVAGGAPEGALGDGGPPTRAYLAGPASSGSMGIAYGEDGTVYIADARNNRVRAVDKAPSGTRHTRHRTAAETIDTLAGSGVRLGEKRRDELDDTEDGWFYRDVHDLDEVTLDTPGDVVVADDGTVYIADTGNDRVRMIRPGDDTVRTVAGTSETPGYDEMDNGDGGRATDAYLDNPAGLALGPDDTLYVSEDGFWSDGGVVRVVDLDEGTIDTAPGTDIGVERPGDIDVGADGALYVVDTHDDLVCKVRPGGDECTTIADSAYSGESGPSVVRPTGVAVAPDGTVYIADAGAVRVRALDQETGEITTVAGYVTPGVGVSGDGGPATSAQIGSPGGLDTGPDGTLYLTDRKNHRVRAVDPRTGTISAVAGTGRFSRTGPDPTQPGLHHGGGGFAGDGGPAGRAKLDQPGEVAVGPDGALYVADTGNNRIRVIGGADVSARGGTPSAIALVAGVVLLTAVLAGAVLYSRRRRHRRAETSSSSASPSSSAPPPGHGPQAP
ncbi:MAG: hypothetical protein GEV10_21895 [Streptosporangiales bacterium]|nr:hypothetical protein [Streptosporangiales bacterium]